MDFYFIKCKNMAEPIIQVEKLSAVFKGREILKDITFNAYPNEITVILGSSGCGKTTVMKHMIGLYPVQKGSISILGKNISKLSEKETTNLHLQMGVLFQNGALLNSMTIAENVGIPLEQHTNLQNDLINDLIRVKLKLVELSHANHLHPSELSGGMRKRAALARAIALDPPLLFCDEPSAGLDPVTLASLDSLFLKLKQQLNISIILITHEVSSIFRLADRIIFLDKGYVVFEGPLKDALNSGLPQVTEFFSKARGRGEA